MKVAFVSDIHSNRIALEAVLDDMPPVDDIVCLGDVIGYGPEPAECVSLIREHASTVLQGNHETYLDDPDACRGNHMAFEGIIHSKNELSSEQLDWANSLPVHEQVHDVVRAVHGHPDPQTPFKYITPRNVTEVVPYVNEEHTHFLTAGHSHVQFKQDLEKFIDTDSPGVFFNPGSVGQPRDDDPRAGYAVVDTNTDSLSLHRVEYDVETVIEQIKQANLPVETGERLRNGRLNR